MKVVIFPHNDPNGRPEEVDMAEPPPPVRAGLGAVFRAEEGYWLLPAELAAGATAFTSEASAWRANEIVLTVRRPGGDYRTTHHFNATRMRVGSKTRTLRGRKLPR